MMSLESSLSSWSFYVYVPELWVDIGFGQIAVLVVIVVLGSPVAVGIVD